MFASLFVCSFVFVRLLRVFLFVGAFVGLFVWLSVYLFIWLPVGVSLFVCSLFVWLVATYFCMCPVCCVVVRDMLH